MPFGQKRSTITFGQVGGGYQAATAGGSAGGTALGEMLTGRVLNADSGGATYTDQGNTAFSSDDLARGNYSNSNTRKFNDWAVDNSYILGDVTTVYIKWKRNYYKMNKVGGKWVNA